MKRSPENEITSGGEEKRTCLHGCCANINFARRNKCNRCSKDKGDAVQKKKLGQEIGKALADKSRGLFSADDWQCNKCGNVNWARRQQCNMCNAPKYGEVEERTGYGGGYNDRGVVEYIERDESDGEYDEFGRKKRKKGSSKHGRNEGTPNNETSQEFEPSSKEDEDDDDGDDGDLSKYDLSGWGDDDDDDDESENQKIKDREERAHKKTTSKGRVMSRSRSRSPPNGRS